MLGREERKEKEVHGSKDERNDQPIDLARYEAVMESHW
jgi:hypothetical protein